MAGFKSFAGFWIESIFLSLIIIFVLVDVGVGVELDNTSQILDSQLFFDSFDKKYQLFLKKNRPYNLNISKYPIYRGL